MKKRLLAMIGAAFAIGSAAVAYAYDDDLAWKFDVSGSTPVAPASTDQSALGAPISVCSWGFGSDAVGTLETRPFSFLLDVFSVHFEPLGFMLYFK